MRNGVTAHLLISLALSIFIIGLTFFLGSQKDFSYTSLFMTLKTDYQMESAVILAWHELKNKAGRELPNKPLGKQMIAPGTYLSSAVRQDSLDKYTVSVDVQGSGLTKGLNATIARHRLETPAGEDPVSPAESNVSWTITFQTEP
jgi:hypothetical protein